MPGGYSLKSLQQDWIAFLQRRDQQAYPVIGIKGVVVSSTKKDKAFRWILFTAAGIIKKFRPDERRRLVQEFNRAMDEGQKTYVVVHFSIPEPKVVVMPAERVVRTKRVVSTRGGIPWL